MRLEQPKGRGGPRLGPDGSGHNVLVHRGTQRRPQDRVGRLLGLHRRHAVRWRVSTPGSRSANGMNRCTSGLARRTGLSAKLPSGRRVVELGGSWSHCFAAIRRQISVHISVAASVREGRLGAVECVRRVFNDINVLLFAEVAVRVGMQGSREGAERVRPFAWNLFVSFLHRGVQCVHGSVRVRSKCYAFSLSCGFRLRTILRCR